MDDPAFETDTDLSTQSILLAAANHDISALRNLLRNSSANVQDSETLFTPLHAAIAACEPDNEDEKAQTNGEVDGVTKAREEEIEAAVKTMKLLFENGAIWNDLDANGETPGCIAHRLGLKELYELCVDAGVRAELLLSRLDQYQQLGGASSDEDDEDEDEETEGNDIEVVEDGVEVVDLNKGDAQGDESTENPNYLASNLTFERDRLTDSDANGVMMEWETTLMRRSAELLLPAPGLRVLNVGHGMAIIDSIFQEKQPKAHHIIEAHPDVLKRMKEQGWYEKPGVVIHEGRWQDVVPRLVEKNEMFDAIYFDTFAEEYKDLREFFSEYVIGMLDPAGGSDGDGGKFGFFCGMGADRQVVYDVYNKIAEIDLFEAGFDTEWETIPVPNLDEQGEWDGVRRKYWALPNYKLPTCSFIG
ncbi:arginine N-methyltransferase [Parastagonospora nodorum]|nr:arginine N-methyltransferase [Parastagonospora nodorum]KAH4074994.1 arginine N-methyltransferase [Parastagonospora nodorum]KAH4097053.1 arginine N-methyltransferase [Parastagonospora nodorum]KAH4203932.1 arginine N-methyltransferase [Parastagonospora nodorum]KAH5052217.1 arginine N-methyltransferase [Parastagonospora nodorum]